MASSSKKNQFDGIWDEKTGIFYGSFLDYQHVQVSQVAEKLNEKLKLKNEKKKELFKKEKPKKKLLEVNIGGSEGSSSPPKHATQKEEYIQKTGTGHEASAAGDYGGDGRDGKKDHDGDDDGGDGRKGRGGGGRGGGDEKKKKKNIYCSKCERSFLPEDFENHVCKKVHSTSTIDG